MNAPRRALPSTVIDLIRDGVPRADLAAHGSGAVYKALVSTAASALQRGWTYAEWATLLGEVRSRLGHQVRLRGGRTERTERDYHRELRSAWARAEKFVATAGEPYGAAEVAAYIAVFREQIEQRDVSETRRAILRFAADVGERNGTTRPTLPKRAVAEAVGIHPSTAQKQLAAIDRAGEGLRLEVRGWPSVAGVGRPRANAYRLVLIPSRRYGLWTPPGRSSARSVDTPNGEVANSPTARSVDSPDGVQLQEICGTHRTEDGEAMDTDNARVIPVPETQRIADKDGDLWPHTAFWCTVCGWPLDRIHAGIGTHPTCDLTPAVAV